MINIESKITKEFTKYLNDCVYIALGQRFKGILDKYNYEIGRSEKGYLYANIILEDDKEIYQNTLELLNVHNGITYNKIHNKKRVIGFDCNCDEDYVPYLENKKTAKYRDMKYVKNELRKLIKQLKKAGIR